MSIGLNMGISPMNNHLLTCEWHDNLHLFPQDVVRDTTVTIHKSHVKPDKNAFGGGGGGIVLVASINTVTD
jgi:hypothetical protein